VIDIFLDFYEFSNKEQGLSPLCDAVYLFVSSPSYPALLGQLFSYRNDTENEGCSVGVLTVAKNRVAFRIFLPQLVLVRR